MTAFDDARDVLFANTDRAVDAVYSPADAGDGTPCRVIRRYSEPVLTLREGRLLAPSNLIDVRVSEVAAPTRFGTFQIGAQKFQITGEPQLDEFGAIWHCEVKAA